MHLSEPSFFAGVEHHVIEGLQLPISSVAKTVADCFKFRHQIGLDVALEALADAWRQQRLILAELNHFASINRVQRVMQPYVEGLIHGNAKRNGELLKGWASLIRAISWSLLIVFVLLYCCALGAMT